MPTNTNDLSIGTSTNLTADLNVTGRVVGAGSVMANRFNSNLPIVLATSAVATPTVAVTGTPSITGGSLVAGDYYIGYAWCNANGPTLMGPVVKATVASGVVGSVAVGAAPALPTNATSVAWYVALMSTAGTLTFLRYLTNTNASHTLTTMTGWTEYPSTVNLSGSEVTDTSRSPYGPGSQTRGDGSFFDSSFGIWKAATNLVASSGELNTTGYTNAVGGSIARTQATVPLFGNWAWLVTSVSAVGDGGIYTFTGGAAQYTASVWVLGATGTQSVRVSIWDNAILRGSASLSLSTGQWQRIVVTATTLTATTPQIRVESNSASAFTFYADGLQVETGSFATPYIEPPAVGAVTRHVAAVASPNAQTILDAQQGWVAFCYRWGMDSASNGNHGFFEWGDSVSNRIMLYHDGTNIHIGRLTAAAPSDFNGAFSQTKGAFLLFQFQWTATQLLYSIGANSLTVGQANTAFPVIAATTFNIGSTPNTSGATADGDMLWFMAGTGILQPADCTFLSALTKGDPDMDSLTATAAATFCWHADTTDALMGQTLTDTAGLLQGRAISNPINIANATMTGDVAGNMTFGAAIVATNLDANGIYYPMQGLLTTGFTVVHNSSYFQYFGKAKKAYTSAVVRYNITTAPTGAATWAEVGVYKGSIATVGTTPLLTRVATAAMAAVTTGLKSTTVTLTGLVVPGDDLWVVIGEQYATLAMVLTSTQADTLSVGVAASQAAYRPSTGTSTVTPTVTAAAIPAVSVMFA